MSALKVLVNAQYDTFSKILVDYLIDTDNLIDVIDEPLSNNWDSVANYNLNLISKYTIIESQYDFMIKFDLPTEQTSIPQLIFDLQTYKKHIKIKIGLLQRDKFLKLLQEKICFHTTGYTHQNLREFFFKIRELFINAIVLFKQMKATGLIYQEKAQVSGQVFLEYLQLDRQFQRLHQYYLDADSSDLKFNFPATLKSEYQYQEVDTKNFSWGQVELELFILYLIMLYNGRQAALYIYDIQTKKRRITKCINSNPHNQLSQLIASINSHEYDILNHPMYSDHGFSFYHSDILVSYGKPLLSQDDWVLQLGVDFEKKTLWIYFPRQLYFFANIEEFANNFCNRFAISLRKDIKIYDFLHHDKAAYIKQLNTWNQTEKNYPKNKTLHVLFSEQSRKTPDNIALVFENQHLTYKELDKRTNQLAQHIQQYAQSDMICLCLNRSIEMIIAIIGVLKAGSAYVPIDPGYPKERIDYILNDTKSTILLTFSTLEFKNLPVYVKRIDLDKITYLEECTEATPNKTKSSDLAYVIYTSGTTGFPKGVMVNHKNLVQLICSNLSFIHQKYAFATNFVFDVSVYEIFASILYGGALHIFAGSIQDDIPKYIDWIKASGIDYMYIPQFMLPLLIEDYIINHDHYHLKQVAIGVEPIQSKFIAPLLEHHVLIKNGYGLTECTVCSTSFTLTNIQQLNTDYAVLPIGKPLHNVKAYILDHNLNPVPIGVTGELFIGGAGLARGYLNQYNLTIERFIPNPFATERDKALGYTRLYKTGDFVRYLPDGNIQYISRKDSQVKIRGFRIELGEIESVLAQYPEVEKCVVLNYLEPHPYLAAFYVSKKSLDTNMIRAYLVTCLPYHMIPAAIVHVDHLPLTINGKIDRKALPSPVFKGDRYIEPRDDKEALLCQLWQEGLGVERVGITDNFFSLGGHSILAVQISHHMSVAFNQLISAKYIFKYPTIEELSQVLK